MVHFVRTIRYVINKMRWIDVRMATSRGAIPYSSRPSLFVLSTLFSLEIPQSTITVLDAVSFVLC